MNKKSETEETPSKDNLAKDLILIVQENLGSPEDYKSLIESLTIYIVNRDHKVLEHGIKLGKEQK